MTKKLYNEDAAHIVSEIMYIVDKKMFSIYDIDNGEMEQNIWTDDVIDKIDALFDEYSEGWRNYN